jgi:hypothetical protein
LLDQNVDGRLGQNAKEAKEPTDQNGDREEFRMASCPQGESEFLGDRKEAQIDGRIRIPPSRGKHR